MTPVKRPFERDISLQTAFSSGSMLVLQHVTSSTPQRFEKCVRMSCGILEEAFGSSSVQDATLNLGMAYEHR